MPGTLRSLEGSVEGIFNGSSTNALDNTLSILCELPRAMLGTKVSIHKAMLLSALTIDTTGIDLIRQSEFTESGNQSTIFRFANPSIDGM